MMGWYGGGAGWAMMAVTSLLGLLLIAVVVWAVVRMVPPVSRFAGPQSIEGGAGVAGVSSAQDILDQRFAAGEIDVEQYRAAVHELSAVRRR